MRIPDEKKSSIMARSRKPARVRRLGISSIFSTSRTSRKEMIWSVFCLASFILEEESVSMSRSAR